MCAYMRLEVAPFTLPLKTAFKPLRFIVVGRLRPAVHKNASKDEEEKEEEVKDFAKLQPQ